MPPEKYNKVSVGFDKKSEGDAYSWINRPAKEGYEFFHSRLIPPNEVEDSTQCTECINVFSRIRDETKDPKFDQMLKNVVKEKLCESFGYFKAMVSQRFLQNLISPNLCLV